MDRSLVKILNQYRTDNSFNTHVSMIKPRGVFNFSREGLEEFMEKYCSLLFNNPQNFISGVAEKPQQYLPVLVDVDIKIINDGSIFFDKKLYNDEQVKTIIEVYQSILRKIVEGCTDEKLIDKLQ